MRGSLSLIVAALVVSCSGRETACSGRETASPVAEAQEPQPASPPRGQRIIAFFVGTLPCADCSGILTELTLFSHVGGQATYWLKETYLGKPTQGAPSESSGVWALEISQSNSDERVYRLVEPSSLKTRVFLKVSDDELRMADRQGRPIEPKLEHALMRRPVPEKPLPHAAPPGRYLVGFYTGTVPCVDCDGVRVELSLFDGPRKLGLPSYWLKETRLGGLASEAAESSGQWVSRRNLKAPQGAILRLLDANQEYLEHGPEELKLIQRWREKFPHDRAGTITRGMAVPFGVTWYEAFGCSSISRGGIDSAAGKVKCGDTVIGYDMGGNAGDWCNDNLTMDLSIGGIPMRMCTLDDRQSVSLAVSLPGHDTNLYVEKSTPEDTMVLLAMARNLADLFRAEEAQSSSPSTNQDSRRPSRKMR